MTAGRGGTVIVVNLASDAGTPRAANGKRIAPGVLVPDMTLGRFYVVLTALMLGSLLAAMDTAIVNTSLPTIAGALKGFSGYAWVATAYLLASAVVMPIAGKLSDLYGRKKLFNTAIVLFMFGSLACASAQSMTQLIVARGVQGLGGGAIQAITFAILGDLISPRERGRYIAIYVGASTVAAIGGPLLGGFIVDHFAWEWVFLINLPLGVLALAGSVFVLRLPFPPKGGRLDVLGAVLLASGLTCLMLALENGRHGWVRPSVVGLFVGAAVLLTSFIAVERNAPEPMIPLTLFQNRIATWTYVMGALIGAVAFGSANVFLPIYFQNAKGVSSTKSGLYIAPIIFGAFMGTLTAGRLIARTGRYKIFPIVGCCSALVGALFMLRLSPTVPYWQLGVPLFFSGMGAGAVFTTSSVAMQNSIDRSVMGVSTATMTFFRSFGGSLGIALFGTLFSARVASVVGRAIRGTGETRSVSTLIRDPKTVRALPSAVRTAVVNGLGSGVKSVYVAVIGVLLVLLAVCLTLGEIPLATGADSAPAIPVE